MLAEFFKKLQDAAAESVRPVVIKGLSTSLVDYVHDPKTGKVTPYVKHAVPVSRQLGTFAHFVKYIMSRVAVAVKTDSQSNDLKVNSDGPIALYDETGCLYIEQPESRATLTARVDFEQSIEWKWVEGCGGKLVKHLDFLDAIRVTLAGCLNDGPALLKTLSDVRYTSGENSSFNMKNGNDAMGRDIAAQISNFDKLPDTVTLSIAPFKNLDFKFPLQCDLRCVPSEKAFKLTPFPESLTRMTESMWHFIGTCIEATKVAQAFNAEPVLNGGRVETKDDE